MRSAHCEPYIGASAGAGREKIESNCPQCTSYQVDESSAIYDVFAVTLNGMLTTKSSPSLTTAISAT